MKVSLFVSNREVETKTRVSVHQVRCLIGRNSGDLRIKDSFCSAVHALLYETSAGLRLRDLHSTNGTFIAGKRISDCPLRKGDVFSIGHTTIEVLNYESSKGHLTRDDADAEATQSTRIELELPVSRRAVSYRRY